MLNDAVLPRLRGALLLSLCALATTLPACDNGPATAASVDLAAPSTTVYIGGTLQITPTIKDKSGKTLTTRPIVYQTSAPNIAAVSNDGLVLGVSAGAAIITATVDGVTGRLSLVVAPVPVNRITMQDTATVFVGGTKQLTATALDSAGHVLSDRTLAWASSATSVATVSSTGLVTGVAAGTANITASVDGKSATTRVTVTPAPIASIDVSPNLVTLPEGGTTQLTATPKDATGKVLTGRTIVWSSTDTTRATVSQTGLVTGILAGVANIKATGEGVVGAAGVLVVTVPVASVKITPDTVSVPKDSTVQLSAQAFDAGGAVLTRKTITWSSSNTAIATVDATGKVKGVAFGTTTVIAQSELKADTAIVNVLGSAVASITILPSPAEMGIGRSGRFRVILKDASGAITQAPVTWQTSDSTAAPVDSTGLVTAVGPAGAVRIFALAGGRVAAVNMNLTTVTVATVGVIPPSKTMAVGDLLQIGVTIYDASSNLLNFRTYDFSSSNPAVATVGADGLVKAVSVGTATITVTSEGITNTCIITVQ